MFEVAYFWRLDPGHVMALTLDRFDLYARQADRIAEQIQNAQNND